MSTETVTGEANLVRVKKPKYLTLVGKPANKVAFKVVRSDIEEGAKLMKPTVVRRQRRSDTSPILRLTFPEGYADADIAAQLEAFGLSGYNVATVEGVTTATRADLKSIATETTMAVRLTSDGITATIEKPAQEAQNPKSQIAVASLAFRGESFDAAKVAQWLQDNGIEAEIPAEADGDGEFTVIRHEVPEGEETRVMEIAPGVTAVLIRADMADIPAGYVATVNETAYGNWGWGQLDFAAAMADEAFTEVMDDAVYRLRDVLKNILLYSALPLADRKTLMVNALEQFKAFSVGILDSLPRQVLMAVVRSATNSQEKTPMSKTQEGGTTNKPAETKEEKASETTLTREDVQTMIQEGITAALAAREEKADTKADADAGKTDDRSASGKADEGVQTLTRADLEAVVKGAVAPLVERIEKVEGETVVRSDLGDGKTEETNPDAKEAEGKTKDVFRGSPLFATLGLRRTAAK